MEYIAFRQLGIALGLGLLVGLQREWAANPIAGIRTFALITVFGTLNAQLAREFGAWMIPAGLIALAVMVGLGYFATFKTGESDPGLTTELAALVMYAVGAALVCEPISIGMVVGGSVVVLLHQKRWLHILVSRIGEADIRGVIQLVLIGLVILPVLPNRTFGPYGVLNPFEIWLMVVLIAGISMGSYLAFKFFSARAGTLLGGIMGGLISSTATAVSYARRSRQVPESASLATLVIMISSTVVFGRVVVEVAVVAPAVLPAIAPPLVLMMLLMLLISAGLFFFRPGQESRVPVGSDPLELKAGILFGLLYALIIFAVAAVKEHLGESWLYLVAVLSGLTDMDAITLSTAQLIKAERLSTDTGWRMILVGALSNLVFKGGTVALIGHPRLVVRIYVLFGLSLAGGVLLLLLWPG